MDNNVIANTVANSALAPYLQQTVQKEEGLICTVSDFEEARKKPAPKDSKRIYYREDLKVAFAKFTDKDGKVTMATFELNEIPNPIPITEAELSGKIGDLEKGFNAKFNDIGNKFNSIETRLDKLMEFIMSERGNNNGASGIFQSTATV